jgi:hypothetical protein
VTLLEKIVRTADILISFIATEKSNERVVAPIIPQYQATGDFEITNAIPTLKITKTINFNISKKSSFSLKLRLTTIIWKTIVYNWVIAFVAAAPSTLNRGIRIMFKTILIITEVTAIMFNCVRLPFAVRSAP